MLLEKRAALVSMMSLLSKTSQHKIIICLRQRILSDKESPMHVPCLNMSRSKTCEKIFMFYIENIQLPCCCGAANPNDSQN